MKKIFITTAILISAWHVAISQSPTTTRNFVMETVLKTAGKKTTGALVGLPVDSASRTIQYMDGLGRPIQTVQWQGSPGKKDVVSFSIYDGLGREGRKYLPYADQYGSDGSFRGDHLVPQSAFYSPSGWDADVVKTPYPYSQTVFEASPLNRVLEQGSPGAVWQPYSAAIANSGHTVRPGYGLNAAGEVALWTVNGSGASTSGSYAAGRLSKSISRDENWTSGKAGTTEQFTDLQGRVVLKRVWETEGTALNTHYIYDRYGNLGYVVPPAVTATSFTEASDANFTGFIYAYHYDGRKRLIEKKVPGKGWEHIVYNKLDQVVLTQDAVQRGNGQWSFTKYDALGRTVITGIHANTSSRTDLQAYVDLHYPNGHEVRTMVNTYGYTLTGSYPFDGISQVHMVTYYDDYDFYGNSFGQPNGTTQVTAERTKGLVTGTRTTTLGTGTMLLTVNYYDADGRAVASKSQNHLGGSDVVNSSYRFDGSLDNTTRIHTVGGTTTTVYNAIVYDHMGRKVSTRQNINSQGEVRLNKLEYNGIGQLKGKRLHSTDGTNFYQNTIFGYNERGWLKSSSSSEFNMQLDYETGSYPQYNGNIANQRWGASLGNVFSYQYDKLNRLKNGTSTGTVMGEVLTYDVMGNIATLSRDGSLGTYSYNGNRLYNITGGTIATGNYAYDDNGNATSQTVGEARLATGFTYNHLNLPVTVINSAANLTYTYDATGAKLRKVNSTTATTTDYMDGIQYTNGVIDFIQTEEGRAVNLSGTYKYEYNLSDHLGNVRYSFDIYGGAVRPLQEDDYYAFGLKRNTRAGTNSYLYNSKELQDELGQYDYGARFYDPIVGRWNSVDPSAENYAAISPYNYVLNNPMKRIDPNGKDAIFNITRDKDGNITGVTVSTTVYITGSGASKERAKELNSYAKSIMKSKEVDGVTVSFGINYEYSKDKTKGDLKNGENLLTFDSGIEGENGNTSHVTAIGEMAAGNFGTIYSSGKSNGTVLHETNHLLGLSDRYQETQMAISGPRTTQPHIGYEHDIMGKSSEKGYKAIYYQYFLNKASSVMTSSDKFFYHPMVKHMYNRQNPSIPYSQVVDKNPNGTLKDYTGIRR